MLVRRCIQCDKPLPADYLGDRCSLCAIGLFPTPAADDSFEVQARHVVEGRRLSGTHCPSCHAELTMGDLGLRSCAICGAHFTPEKTELLLQAAQLPATLNTQFRDTTLGDKVWPDDAPLR